ncbi:MAG: hypothetical protein ACOC1V_05575 [Candidatus Saliniplasma sp.]
MNKNSPESPKDEGNSMEGTVQELINGLLRESKVFVVGVGGCGCNTVQYINEKNVNDVKTIGINTDDSILGDLNVDRQMLIGKEITNGNGANGDPKIGKRAAQMNEEQILKAIKEADFVVVVAGLGGGTGSGAAPVIADLAKRNDKMVVSYAVMPFSAEVNRYEKAREHLENLTEISHAITVFENDHTLIHSDKTPAKGLELTGKMLYKVVERLKMECINEFFHEIGLDAIGLSENLSSIENQIPEREVESEKAERPPVIEALSVIEESKENASGPTLDSFLETHQ